MAARREPPATRPSAPIRSRSPLRNPATRSWWPPRRTEWASGSARGSSSNSRAMRPTRVPARVTPSTPGRPRPRARTRAAVPTGNCASIDAIGATLQAPRRAKREGRVGSKSSSALRPTAAASRSPTGSTAPSATRPVVSTAASSTTTSTRSSRSRTSLSSTMTSRAASSRPSRAANASRP